MPSGHANNGDLAKRRERISKAIQMLIKIRASEACGNSLGDISKDERLREAIDTLTEIREDLKD